MKIMIPNIILFQFFSFALISTGAFGKTLETLKVPSFMAGVKKDPTRSGVYYLYEGAKVVNQELSSISRPDEVESFVVKLWRIYKNDQRSEFIKLFTPEALAEMRSLGEEVFEREWKALSSQKTATLKSYYKLKGGVVVNWSAGKIPRGLFLKKIGGEYKFAKFEAQSSDAGFYNRSLYLTYFPRKEKKAVVEKEMDPHANDYTVVLRVDPERPYAHILKKEKGRWEAKVSLIDNSKGKGRFDDLDPRIGYIKIEFKESHFTGGKRHELLALQSNFPISYYPFELAEEGNLLMNPL